MFSSNDLIHYVFANESDTYYGDDLLKLNLEQYLWLKLHEKYPSVYFLSGSDNGFDVRTYGDLACKTYKPSGKPSLLKGKQTEINNLGKWLHKQLTANWNEPAAFVCPLEDFCDTLDKFSGWAGILEGIAREKNRTGIIVLTVPVLTERSRALFLRSPVFEHLRENAVLDARRGALRDLYGSIRQDKGEACVFLNTFPPERIRSVLLHVMMEQGNRFLSQEETDTAARYLAGYMSSLELQRDQPLFGSQTPGMYMRFSDLYDRLKDDEVWKRLTDRCLKEGAPANGAVVGAYGEFCVIRDTSRYPGKCMTLTVPDRMKKLDSGGERAEETLLDIKRELLRPKNRAENRKLAKAAEGFLHRLTAVAQNDLDTYKRILAAVHFCVTWMYVPEDSEEEKQAEKITECLERYIDISDQCFQLSLNPYLVKQEGTMGKLTDISIQQARAKYGALKKALRQYKDFVDASIMNMSMATFPDNIVQRLEELEREAEAYRAIPEKIIVPEAAREWEAPQPMPEPSAPEKDDEIYDLRDYYTSIPPV